MTASAQIKAPSMALPLALLTVAMFSVQIGAALSKHLFPMVGAAGAAALRLAFAALILWAVQRPWRHWPSLREARMLIVYGLSIGAMNLTFYSSLSRIPLGIAVALEFTGPLVVAMVTSRRSIDFLWIVLAVLGLLALLPLRRTAGALDPVGVGFALAAGACWAVYIVVGQKAGNAHGAQTVVFGISIAALLVVPIGIAQVGPALFAPAILPMAIALALLASAIPFSLEMVALTRIPTRTFGVLMSAEPALGALSGLAFLHERLNAIQWGAIGCIMLASAGSALTGRPSAPVVPGSLPD